MEKFRIYGNRTPNETELEKSNRLLARKAAIEGMVLLKNDNALPIKSKKVALYGAGARCTVKGGSGSGDVHERFSVNIEDGLKNNGFEIVGGSWLARFTQKYEQDKKEFVEKVEDAIKGYTLFNVMSMFDKIHEFKLAYPVGDEITDSDLTEETDTAIYVVARQAGEGDDRKLEKGDYLLSDLEIKNLETCSKHYKKLILVINTGSIVDLSVLDKVHINAVIYYGQAGEEGGNALGEILSGKATPSGKMTDTWAKNYFDYPSAKAILSPEEKLEENYYEGIYVGYRWFDAKNIPTLFPFGYGLSYTTFDIHISKISAERDRISLSVVVRNTGSEYAGKEVVQVYLAKPNIKYDGEKKSLVAYGKTKLLAPNESQQIIIEFKLRDCAVYDENKASFILENGHYGLYVGPHSANINAYAVLNVANDIIVEKCKNLCKKTKSFFDFAPTSEMAIYDSDIPVIEIESIEFKQNIYENPFPIVSTKIQEYLDTLSNKELAMFCMGGGYFTKTFNKVNSACGNTTSRLLKKGIPNIVMSDGPAGINLLQTFAYTKNGRVKYVDELPKDWQWGFLKRLIPKLRFLFAKADKHTYVYQYCTAWPNATMMAQSWNDSLVEEVGTGIGKEMLQMGVTLWLAPALNIHRNPLCGRNFEYYSEDPILSGMMASSMTKGVQSCGGVGVTIKHFACNNRENDRMHVSSNLSERALREIYLKGFRIACSEKPLALMTSYNRINGVYAPNNRDLLIDILRSEWGYNGLVMSDWNAVNQCSIIEAIKNGNNMIMPGDKKTYINLIKAIKNGDLKRDSLLYSAAYALNVVFYATTSKGF